MAKTPPAPPPRTPNAPRPSAARPPAPTAAASRSSRAAQDAQARTVRQATLAPRATGKLAAVLLSGVRCALAPLERRAVDARDIAFADSDVVALLEDARARLGAAVAPDAPALFLVTPLFAALDSRAAELIVRVGFPVPSDVGDVGGPFAVETLEPAHALELEMAPQKTLLGYMPDVYSKCVAFSGLPGTDEDIGGFIRIWQPSAAGAAARLQVEVADRVADKPYTPPEGGEAVE